MRETWYVLEDGTAVHPSEVSLNKDGALAHKNGMVQMRGETPRSRGVDPDEERAKAKPAAKPELPPAKAKDMQPEEPVSAYKTRETKTRR